MNANSIFNNIVFVCGLACIVYACLIVYQPLGLVVLGLSLMGISFGFHAKAKKR